MKKILIPTDFSEHARHTLHYVLDLVGDTQTPCEVLLLNTYMVQQTDPQEVIRVNDDLKKKSKTGLEQEKQVALQNKKSPLISISTASHMGSLNNVVLQLLKKDKIDLVAMGKNGGRNVESVSALLKQEHCPLLITYLGEEKVDRLPASLGQTLLAVE